MTLCIQPLRQDQIEAVKGIVIEGALEFFGQPPLAFEDMDAISTHYAPPSGIFLVLMDADRVVGAGAIRRLDDQTCELKRLWFLPVYRGQGSGTRMCEALLDFARSAGYLRIRLDTVPVLTAANRLYERLGFQPIDRYNDGPGTIFMEKHL